ncbi:MAG: hypothetical protein HXY30_10510 [Pseudorhodoplanes sp.]|nr:hypothetical protein [Pseudorhodoplanes sp.]
MILGSVLTVGIAYLVDSAPTSQVAAGPSAAAHRSLVNWDVVEANWATLKSRAREGWSELRSRVDRS